MKKFEISKFRIPDFIIFAIPTFLVFFVVLLAYWPGILVSDSMVQWNQTQMGVFDDWHPAYNTIYIFLLTKIWNNPGFVLLVQCITMSLTIGYFFSVIKKHYNVNKYLLLLASFLFAIIPLNFNFAVTLLKDTMYSTFVILLTAIIIEIINNEKFFTKKISVIALFLVCLVISIFRHNGVIVVALTLLGLILFNRKKKAVYIVFVGWVITYLLMTSVGFKILNIRKNSYANTYGPVSHLIARMLNTQNMQFTEEELELINEYTDIEKLKDSFNDYNMDYSINSQKIEKIKESGSEYLKYGIKKSIENPKVFIKHYLKLTSFLYSPVAFEGSYTVGMFVETDLWVYKDQYSNLNENSKIPSLLPKLKDLELKYQSAKYETFTMRPAIYMYSSIVMVFIIGLTRKNKKIWFVLMPTIFNTISLIPAIPVAMTRYVYATMFGFWCFAIWFIYEMYFQIKSICCKKIDSGKKVEK